MSTIVTRAAKGSPLTHAEVDANFTNLNNDKFQEGNAIGNTTPAAGTFTTLTGNSTSQFGRSSANYIQATGNTTTNSPEISALGSDTNIPLTLESKGTGAINLAVGSSGVNVSNGQTVTALTRTGFGSGYTSIPSVTISAPTTSGGVTATGSARMGTNLTPTIVSGGTGYTANDLLTVSGGTGTASVQIRVSTVLGGVITSVTSAADGIYSVLPTNPVFVTGGTGSGATFNLGTWYLSSVVVDNAGSGYVEQPTVTFSGGGGSGAAAYATVGSTTVIRSIAGANTNSFEFYAPSNISNSQASFAIRDSGGAQSAYPVVWSGGDIRMYPAGGTNIDFRISSAGTGAVRLTTNGTSFVEQLRVAHTASAVNYVQVTGAATGNFPVMSVQGSDANPSLGITAKGTGSLIFFTNNAAQRQFRITHTASSVNYLNATGAATGASPVLSSVGDDTNIDLNLTTKGTGVVNLNTGAGTQVRIVDSGGTTVNRIHLQGQATGFLPVIASRGSDTNLGMSYSTQGTGPHDFYTAGTSFTQQFKITHTASAVNYVQVTGAATTARPVISAQGSDTNVSLDLNAKGVATIRLQSGSANILRLNGVASAANFVEITSSATGVAPKIEAAGSDTNIDLNLTTKGTGRVQFGTHTATALTISGYIEIKDAGGTIRKLAVVT